MANEKQVELRFDDTEIWERALGESRLWRLLHLPGSRAEPDLARRMSGLALGKKIDELIQVGLAKTTTTLTEQQAGETA